jgi:transcriptional regulator GlxA family with amidase domain
MARDDKKNKTIGIVTYPGVALLDLVATKKSSRQTGDGHQVPGSVRRGAHGAHGLQHAVEDHTRKEVRGGACPLRPHCPGRGVNSLFAMGNERILDYLRFAAYGAEIVGSVSTGVFLLAAAGLLEGRQATTHPAYGELLQKLG